MKLMLIYAMMKLQWRIWAMEKVVVLGQTLEFTINQELLVGCRQFCSVMQQGRDQELTFTVIISILLLKIKIRINKMVGQ